MSKVQKRKSVSLAPDVYGVAQRSAARDGIPVARWVTRAVKAYAHPDDLPHQEPADLPDTGPDGRPWRTG